jgi:hypothetical protein
VLPGECVDIDHSVVFQVGDLDGVRRADGFDVLVEGPVGGSLSVTA